VKADQENDHRDKVVDLKPRPLCGCRGGGELIDPQTNSQEGVQPCPGTRAEATMTKGCGLL
jgi:hypothetical protein